MKELIAHRTLLPAFERFAAKVGVHDGDYHATFAEHADRTLRLRDALHRELGLGAGDRFAVLATNSHQYLELYHAGFLGGGVINPLNLRLAGKELQFILADSGTEVVFVDVAFAEHLDRNIADVRTDLPLRKIVLIGDGDVPHDVRYEDLLAAGEPNIPEETDETDPVVLMYTGGTTGRAKGVLLEQRAEVLNLYHIGLAVRFDEQRIYLHQTPMFHAASMGGVLGIPGTGGVSTFIPLFEPGAVMDNIAQYSVDWTTMVPTMIAMVLNHPSFDPARLSTLRDLVYGASPMPLALLEQVRKTLPSVKLWQGYGMTECSSVLTFLTPADHDGESARLRSAGRPALGIELSVRDHDGREVERGAQGEVWARGGNFMREYWHRPEETEAAFRDGWYHTGDAGYLDGDGYLYLVDRVTDMIVSGGENVYSVEVENAIASHPAVAQVAVIGVPDPVWGEAVHAIVVLHPGQKCTAEEIKEQARQSVAGYKVPKTVEFRDEPLPLSGAMKPLKRELRREYLERHPPPASGPGERTEPAR
ncbi:MAG TPA: AMP-binding protein [Acidimicrobiales bacterium]|jgi:long-chain acyl-CoA synthetase|nr:AMP-binding protein [Acidimicrobiales bacterium]